MLNLNCPNCHRIIGELKTGESPVYLYHNDKMEPICPLCGTGKSHSGTLIIFALCTIVAAVTLIMIFA